MAITHLNNSFRANAALDEISGPIPVRGMCIVSGASGPTTIRIGGAAGPKVYDATPTASTTTWITLPTFPPYLYAIFVEAIGTGNVLWVMY
jgi:hypothetical protein